MRPGVISERPFCASRALKIQQRQAETSRRLFKAAFWHFSWPQKDLFHLRSRNVTCDPSMEALWNARQTPARFPLNQRTEFKAKWKSKLVSANTQCFEASSTCEVIQPSRAKVNNTVGRKSVQPFANLLTYCSVTNSTETRIATEKWWAAFSNNPTADLQYSAFYLCS